MGEDWGALASFLSKSSRFSDREPVFWTSWFDEEFDLEQEEDDEVEVLDSVRDEWDEVIEEEEVDKSEFELDVEDW